MSRTTFSGPLASGDKEAGIAGGPNVGLAVLSQTAVVNRDATLVQTVWLNLPAGAQILDIVPDVITAYDSATSATLSVGKTAGGADYIGAINAKTGGRAAPALSPAQAAAMADIGSSTAVAVTVTSVGQPTVGQARVTLLYVQKG